MSLNFCTSNSSMNTYIRTFLATALSLLLLILVLNVVVDPMCYMNWQNMFNSKRVNFDPRVQKTNRIMHVGDVYDGILLGSSRMAAVDVALFRNEHIFNYGLGSIYPSEYDGYIAAASLRHNITAVYLGLDFYGTSRHQFSFATQRQPQYYIDGAVRPVRILGALLSLGGARHALKTAVKSVTGQATGNYFDDCFVELKSGLTPTEKRAAVNEQLHMYHEECYGARYEWDQELPQIFEMLRRKWPEKRFVVFTTPISWPMFSLLVRDGRLPDYERWLRAAVQAFGTVHDFMGRNSVTMDMANYGDAHHFLPPVAAHIVHRITGQAGTVPNDFGVLVTPQNLEEHLGRIRVQAAQAEPEPLRMFAPSASASE